MTALVGGVRPPAQAEIVPYDKTDQRFKGMINLAATAIALKMNANRP
jgi:hypothetical protein